MPRLDDDRLLKSQPSQRAGSRGKQEGRDKDEPSSEALSAFRASAERTCEREFWSKNRKLARRVVGASLSAGERSSSTSFRIDDDAAAAALTSARRVIKEASQNKTLDCLGVGAHCLRAVSASHLMRQVKHQETSIRVLYHVVVTCEDAHEMARNDNNNEEGQGLALSFGLLAYDTLGRVLQQGGYSVSSKHGRVQFVPPDEDRDEPRDENQDGSMAFCVPTDPTGAAGGRSGEITPDLVCTIAMAATLAVCRMLLAAIKRRRTISGESTPPSMLARVWGWSNVPPVSTLSHLSYSVLPLWISYLEAEASKDEAAAAKEVVSNFKRVHLLLWEAAENERDPIHALQLRERSLASLLCCVNGRYWPSRSVHQLLVSKGHFEVACTMAKKAVTASTDEAQRLARAHAVTSFHATVGGALDAFADQLVPTAYVEYCAQRALDGVKQRQNRPFRACSSSCLFRMCPHNFGHFDCENSNEAAVMSLFFLALAVRDHLTGVDDDCSPILEDANRIVRNFEAVTLVDAAMNSKPAQEMAYRSFHLLWNLKLHVAVFDAVNKMSDPSSANSTMSSLSSAADILVRCVGPLASTVLQTAKLKAVPQLRKAVLESFTRGISAYEGLIVHSNSPASHYSHRSEDAASALVEALLKGRQLSDLNDMIEKGAKFLSVVARRRHESSSNPLVHLTLSLQLYAALDAVPGLESSNRMSSSRWLWLASLYSSMDRTGEEALSTAVALHYLTLERAFALDSVDNHSSALQLLCTATKGVIPAAPQPFTAITANEKSKGLVSRLISLCASNRITLGTPIHAGIQISTPSSVSEVLVTVERESVSFDNGFEGRCGLQVDVTSLLDVIFSRTTCATPIRTSHSLLNVATVVAIMEALGKKLQTDDSCEDDDSLANLYSTVVERGSSFIRSISENDLGRRVLSSVYYVCASVCLFSQHALFDFDSWNLKRYTMLEEPSASPLVAKASTLTEHAAGLVASSAPEADDMSVLATVLRQLIALYQFQLDEIQGLSNDPICNETLISLLGQLADSMHHSSERTAMRELSRWWLMSLLSRLCDSSAADGEKIQALQFAIWNVRAAGKVKLEASAWLEATALSLQALDTAFVSHLHQEEYKGESSGYQVDLKANTLRWKLQRTLDHDELLDIEQEMFLLLSTANTWIANRENPVFPWAKSTTMLGLSEVYHKLRRYEDSIYFAGECFRVCRSLSHSEAGLTTQVRTTDAIDEMATATLQTRSWLRRVDCLRATSHCYWNIGDRFRSALYAEQALRLVSTSNESSFNQFKLPDFIAFIRSLPFTTSTEMQCRRLLFLIKARSTSWDLLTGQFQDDWRLGMKPRSSASPTFCGVNHVLEQVNDLESVLSLFVEGQFLQGNQLDDLYSKATSTFNYFQGFPWVADLSLSDRSGTSIVAPMVSFRLKLAIARRYLFDPQSAVRESDAVLACEYVVDASTDCECRAIGLYFLGLIALKKAQRVGDLVRLWSGYSNQDDESDAGSNGKFFLGKARKHFMMMLPLLGPSTESLTRDALRSLALTTGPCSEETAEMIHTSIGSSLRQIVARKIEKQTNLASPSEGKVVDLLKALDMPFGHTKRKDRVRALLSTIERLMPVDWRLTACALCPSGEMLITSLSLDDLGDLKMTNACIFPDAEEGTSMNSAALYDAIMVPLDKVISENQDQLQDATSADTLPREWWSQRRGVDSKLQDLLVDVEKAWFSSEPAKKALSGCDDEGDSHALHVNLASKFEAASSESLSQKDIFQPFSTRACTLLVLDENLQRFPFESLPMFDGVTVCRQPSLPFLATKLWELSSDDDLECRPAYVDLQRVRYVLDPESDLSATSNRLQPFLDSIERTCSSTWQRVVREAPSKEFIEESLSESEGLYLYFGHGNGQSYFSKSDVEGFLGSVDGDASERRVRASVVLMGCSSGRLESVNRKNTKLLDRQLPLFHDPEGLALCYAGAGAPCVVGNLWDVTDRDIDTFAMDMLQRFVAEDPCTSLAECVAQSRSACKLRYGTGGAPVCYGIPVIRKHSYS